MRSQGIGDAIVAYIGSRPWVTIREVQVGFPEASPSSIEATVRNLSAAGKLIKDQCNPRKCVGEMLRTSGADARHPCLSQDGAGQGML